MNLSRLTIRARITGGSLIIAILISVIAGIVIFAQVQRIVSDGQLRVLDNVEAPYLAALGEDSAEEVDPPGATQLVAVVGPDSAVRVDTLPSSLRAEVPTLLANPNETWPVPAGDETYLVRVTTVETATGTWNIITATLDDSDTSVLNEVALLLIGSIAGINIAFGVASWFIGSAALSPVARMRRSAAELATAPGHELLPVGPARDELADLARTLNELIAQLRASAERERNIVSDASHEFRTPLAILTTQLELAQRQSQSLPQMQQDVAAAQRTLTRLSALATSMLELSRIDSQSEPGSSTVEELAEELTDAADRGRTRVGACDIRIEYAVGDLGESAAALISGADFGRICDNLISNSLAAMGKSGLIELSLSGHEHDVVLRVSDTAGGMDDAFVPHAFDRFSRSEASRSGAGAGLGLSIVAGVVALAAGEVRLENRAGDGLTVEVRLPVAQR